MNITGCGLRYEKHIVKAKNNQNKKSALMGNHSVNFSLEIKLKIYNVQPTRYVFRESFGSGNKTENLRFL